MKGKAGPDEPSLEVKHRREEDGWRVAETVNFRLLHKHPRDLAESVLRTAERTRKVQLRKWFGDTGEYWDRKCRIYLYASGESYSEATGAPVNPGGGHTDIRLEESRVLSRCIHLHGSREFLLKGVVPHEVTHAVLAGRLSDKRVPRWADEGMAILAEAPSHIDVHFRFLPRWRADDALFGMRTLIEMRDYPEPHAIGPFYAQSVSLVDFLTRQKGAERFADFVRDGERGGYAASLRKHYGWSFAELDRHWQRHAFFDNKTVESTTTGGG
ncbi:MAG: peptidase MA family metallohydrolase [Gemmataceae bacterium]